MKKRVFAFLALLLFQTPAFGTTKIGIDGDKFTINGKETFLLGVTYFDAFNWRESDLDELGARGYNLIRICLDWRDQGFFDSAGNLIWAQPLVDLVEAADTRELIVDVTILDQALTFRSGNREKAVRQAVSALKGKPNVIFDIMNAHDYGKDALSHTEVKTLIDAGIEEDPNAIITVSSGPAHIIKDETLRKTHVDEELNTGIMAFTPHLPRTSDWYSKTDERVTLIKNYLNDKNRIIPVYLQEEARRGVNGLYPVQKEFLQAAKTAFSAGVAAWIFHTAAGFDLTGESFFSQLDSVEKSTIEALPKEIFGSDTSSSTTASTLSGATPPKNTITGNIAPTPERQTYAAPTNALLQSTAASSTSLAAPSDLSDYVPPDSGVANVKSYGAKGDGVTDDTAAINNAIRNRWGFVYFPNGTYLVSDRLEWKGEDGKWRAFKSFLGESRDGTIIKLKNNAPGYGTPSAPKAVVYTASSLLVETPYGGGKDWPGKGEGNEAFQNDIINLTVNTGTGNPGAIGIDYLANNQGTLENVHIVSGDGQGVAGLSMIRKWSGPNMISKVTVEGFNYGIQIDAAYHVTLEHITVKNQTIAGIRQTSNVDVSAFVVRDLVSVNSAPAVQNLGNTTFGWGPLSHAVIIDATLTGGSSGVSAIDSDGSQLFARNISTSGYQSALKNQGSVISGNSVTEFVSGTKTSLFPSPAQSMNLPIPDVPEYTNSNPADWTNVVSYGATPSGGGDDGPAIQAAIDSGKPVVYLPAGNYDISSTIKVRGNVRKIVGFKTEVHRAAGRPEFRTENIINDFVIIEGIHGLFQTSPTTQPMYEHASSKTLVLKRIMNSSFNTLSGAGPLFIQDFYSAPIEINGTQVWARQLNPERATPHIVNKGGQLWILGLKTEGDGTIVETKNGGKTEVLGGFLFGGSSSLPAFINTESFHSIVIATVTWLEGFTNYVQETRGSVTKTLAKDSLPPRGTGHFVPLHTGYASAAAPSDTTPPTVSMTAPANGATVSGPVTVSANASDNVGVTGVRFKLDGTNLGVEDTTLLTASPGTQ